MPSNSSSHYPMTVTVLMPVYNGATYLAEAIQSILNQDFTDFELLIMNDGSTDQSESIVLSQTDPRIRYIRNEYNLGLAATLNKGIGLAKGKYIARMDCDDRSLPPRLRQQVAFMEQNPLIAICGTWVKAFNEQAENIWQYPTDYQIIRCQMLFNCCLAHPSIMIRKKHWEQHQMAYDPQVRWGEDYELWLRKNHLIRFANLPEVLLEYRLHDRQMSQRQRTAAESVPYELRSRALAELVSANLAELALHESLSREQYRTDYQYFNQTNQWLWKLKKANQFKKLFPEPIFSEVLFWHGRQSLIHFLKQNQQWNFQFGYRAFFSVWTFYFVWSRFRKLFFLQ